MGLFASLLQPKSASGGVSDVQQVTASGSITVGIRQRVRISIVGTAATTGFAGQGIFTLKFSLGSNSAAASTDLQLPVGIYDWEMGDEFDRLNFALIASAGIATVMRVTP